MAMVTQNSEKFMTVLPASKMLNVSIDTIRRWEKKGLIRAVRGELGERLFDTKELSRIASRGGKSSGVYRILEADHSNITSIELFSGAGGLALGMQNAGIQHKMLVDLDKDSTLTLKQNRPDWDVRNESVTEISLADLRGEVDLISGGFPCQAFSYAGKQLGFADTRGTLFYDFARLIDEVRPKVVVAENVKGLLSHDGGRTIETIIHILEELGYKTAYKVLRSQFLDVPQKRERLIIMATRRDLNLDPLFPAEKNYTISLRSAIENAPSSDGQQYTAAKKEIMSQVPAGGYWKDLPDGFQRTYMGASYYLGGGKTGMARRLSWDEPSLTLTCNPAQKQTERCHPSETRPLSIREYARIQCFPDSWDFAGSRASAYRQIGNAVPVNLGYHIGLAVRRVLGDIPLYAEGQSEYIAGTTKQQEALPGL